MLMDLYATSGTVHLISMKSDNKEIWSSSHIGLELLPEVKTGSKGVQTSVSYDIRSCQQTWKK